MTAVNHQTGCTTFPFISLSSASVPCRPFRSFFQFPLEINLSSEADCSVSCTFLKHVIQEVMSHDVLTCAHVYSLYFLRKILQETTRILSPPEICSLCVFASVCVYLCMYVFECVCVQHNLLHTHTDRLGLVYLLY